MFVILDLLAEEPGRGGTRNQGEQALEEPGVWIPQCKLPIALGTNQNPL